MSLQKYCPSLIADCLRPLILFFNKNYKKKEKQEFGIQELEEEQFQFTPLPKKQLQDENLQYRNEQNNFDVKLDLSHKQQNEEQSSLLSNQMNDNLIVQNAQFKINLEPYDPYYQIIQSKTNFSQLSSVFSLLSKNIIKRQGKSRIQIDEIQSSYGFKMIIRYRMNCSYSFLNRVNQNASLPIQFTNIIAKSSLLETIHSNLTVNQLSFKKFMLLEPRFFHYIKYYNSFEQFHWQICTSTKSKPQTQPTQKQCELTSISCFEERSEALICNTYLQVDLKSNIKASKVLLRVYNEIADYIDKLFDYVESHYHPEDV